MEHLPGGERRFQILTTEMPQPEIKMVSCGGLLHHVSMADQEVADSCANEIRPVRIETLVNHQVDLSKIDMAEINCDLFGIAPRPEFLYARHPNTILLPSDWMVDKGFNREHKPGDG